MSKNKLIDSFVTKFKNHLKDGLEAVSFLNEICCSFALHVHCSHLLYTIGYPLGGGGGGNRTSRPFYADLKGDLIDNLLRKEK